MSWEELQSIYETARAEQATADAIPPVACPNDGELLETGEDGKLHCRFDGWIWDGQPIRYS